jgi:phosphoglucosamine mutase
MQKYPQVLVNVKTKQRVNPDNDSGIQSEVKAIEQKLGSNGRVLLRPSGTEPLIRVMIEGQDATMVTNYAHQLADKVKQAIGA